MEDARVLASLDNWKRRLLDVTKRNRALNFRPTPVTTITLIDEQPPEVFRHLCQERKAMRFRPLEAAKDEAKSAAPTALALDDEVVPDEDEDPSAVYSVYEPNESGDRHKDDILQTRLVPEKLDHSLRRMEAQARDSLEEQGVNTLFLALGMLHYFESDASDEAFRAPLVLLPVELGRKSARTGFTLRATDDDPLVNPALGEYLRRSNGLTLPSLPDNFDSGEAYDLHSLFREVSETVAEHERWQVKMEIHLAFFSFQKLVMYKDLEANAGKFAAHPAVRQVVLRSGSAVRGLPAEIRESVLDEEYPPEAGGQVVDADSSQLRAILAVSKSHDLVIEGPPGTGKSQTITNLIAQTLRDGKSVLFVAEKMAALEVVHSRLVEAGLGEFCLELHSTKANKRAVMREIAAALDASLQRPVNENSARGNLSGPRATLTQYTRAVHEPYGALGISPYEAYGALGKVLDAPKVRLTAQIQQATRADLETVLRDLRDLSVAVKPIGSPDAHPWRDVGRTYFSESDLDTATDLLQAFETRLQRVSGLAETVQRDFCLAPVRTIADAEAAATVARLMERSPGAPMAVLQSAAWNSPPPRALELVALGRVVAALRGAAESCFVPEVIAERHADDAAFMQEYETRGLRPFNVLNGRYRTVRRRWNGYRLPGYQKTLLQQVADMRKVDDLCRERERLASAVVEAQQLFGGLWNGEHSDWNALDRYIAWVVEFRSACVTQRLQEKTLALASRSKPDVAAIDALANEVSALSAELAALRSHLQWPSDYLQRAPFTEMGERVAALRQSPHLAQRWGVFEAARQRVAGGLAAELLPRAMAGEIDFPQLEAVFNRAFLQRWLAEVLQERQPLRDFASLTHEERVSEFKRLDEQVLWENRVDLVRGLRERVQQRLQSPEGSEGMPFLRRQLTLQRGLSPLRTTMQRGYAAIRTIKPVFLMSPLSVAQLLDGQFPAFDLVIFDEASQLPTEDAVGAIARGRQLVVVGDPKQLPPTNFFSAMNGTIVVPMGEDGLPLFEDSESILEEYMGSGAASTRLKWHYRSSHESLIHFSNVSFYDSDLFTFPSVETQNGRSGLTFEWVEDGVYEGKGLNLAEARRVADAVVRHARECPELSLGVGTFNLRQQLAVLDELELRRRQDPSLEGFFARGKREPFIVRNLENIQGDERDVIFLSVTYGKDANGVLRYNFGPLNGENGWRRLNVLTTRARKSMRVFSSMRAEDIHPARAGSAGPLLLRDFLLYAEHGRMDRTLSQEAADTDSPLERDVYLQLTLRGIQLKPQVGEAGYRIDFGVIDDAVPGRYVCGIECDGVAYHASETARDRDRLRQQVLEARGWTILRLWSTDWFKDRQGQIERLLGLIEAARNSAVEANAADQEARARLAAVEAEERAARPEPVAAPAPDSRPAFEPISVAQYTVTPCNFVFSGEEFHTASPQRIWEQMTDVLTVEAPLHLTDLGSRVVARWGQGRLGSRSTAHLRSVLETAARVGLVEVRDDFVYVPGTSETLAIRTRAGTGIPAERIPPEEYCLAIVAVLQRRVGIDRKTLTNSVRALFGFDRTGAKLEAAISAQIDALIQTQTLGEGSTGLRLRE